MSVERSEYESEFVSASVISRVTMSDESLVARIPGKRGPTLLGKSQGDHVSSYVLLKEVVIAAIERSGDIIEATGAVLYTLEAALDLEGEQAEIIHALFERTKKELESNTRFITDKELRKVKQQIQDEKLAPKLIKAAIISNTQIRTMLVEKLIAEYITIRNKQPLTTFPKQEGIEAEPNEGPIAYKAVNLLKKYRSEPSGDILKGGNKARSAKLKPQIETIVNHIKNLFFYPRVPEDKLLTKEEQEEMRLSKKWNQSTVFRDNDLSSLIKVVTTHLKLIFLAFAGLIRVHKEIIDNFTTQVAKEWKLEELEIKKLKKEVATRIIQFFEISSSRSPSRGSEMSESGSSQNSVPDELTLDEVDLGSFEKFDIILGSMRESDDSDPEDKNFNEKGKALKKKELDTDGDEAMLPSIDLSDLSAWTSSTAADSDLDKGSTSSTYKREFCLRIHRQKLDVADFCVSHF